MFVSVQRLRVGEHGLEDAQSRSAVSELALKPPKPSLKGTNSLSGKPLSEFPQLSPCSPTLRLTRCVTSITVKFYANATVLPIDSHTRALPVSFIGNDLTHAYDASVRFGHSDGRQPAFPGPYDDEFLA